MSALLPHYPLSSQKSTYRLPSTPHSIRRPNTPNPTARIRCPVEIPSTRPKPVPLRSVRVTRLHSYYRCLRLPTASALFLACYTCPRVRTSCTPTAGYPWLPRNLYVRLDATSDPGVHPGTRPSVPRSVACWVREPIGPLQRYLFRDSTSSGSASPVTFAPRLLLRLRIKRTVTSTPARLNTRPVASGYLGGVRTH